MFDSWSLLIRFWFGCVRSCLSHFRWLGTIVFHDCRRLVIAEGSRGPNDGDQYQQRANRPHAGGDWIAVYRANNGLNKTWLRFLGGIAHVERRFLTAGAFTR